MYLFTYPNEIIVIVGGWIRVDGVYIVEDAHVLTAVSWPLTFLKSQTLDPNP